MGRFGIDDETIKNWHDKPIMLKGKKNIAVVLFHGWSAFSRQLLNLARILNRKGYWVYLPLLTGHGSRPEDLETVKAGDWIKDAENAIDEIKKNHQIKNIIIGGNSMGGNLAIIGSLRREVSGLILLGTPVHIKHHFFIWITAGVLGLFNIYSKKRYPKNIDDRYPGSTSYQFVPVKSVSQCLKIIKKSVFSLARVNVPILILQTNQDYMVTKYSPWVIYNRVKSKIKKLQWVQSKYDNHTMTDEEVGDAAVMIDSFIIDMLNKSGKI